MNKKQLILRIFPFCFLTLGVIFLLTVFANYYRERKTVQNINRLYIEVESIFNETGYLEDERIKALCFQIIDLNKNKIYNYTMLGYANYMLKNDGKALALFKRAIELNSRDTIAHVFLARVYRRAKNYELALDEINLAFKFKNNKALSNILKTYGLIYGSLNNKEKAIEYFEKALSIDKNNVLLCFLLAEAYFGKKEYYKTIEFCENGLNIYPNQRYLLFFLGQSYRNLDEYSKAVVALEKSLKLFGEQEIDFRVEVLLEIAYSYVSLKNYDKAIEYLEEAEKLDPTVKQKVLYSKILKDFSNKDAKTY